MSQEPFLASVARHYLGERQDDIATLSFVFPSKRSQAFFRHYLAQLSAATPIFAPRMLTMSELIQGLYPELKVLDRTALLFELYEAYEEVCRSKKRESEPFDDFVYWGNIILQDFDTCDRYLINIHHLYRNLRDFKELADDFSYLSEETKREIEHFWGSLPSLSQGVPEQESKYKARFLSFWECLEPLYEAFNKRLKDQGYTYEGHLYRLVAEDRDKIVDRLKEGTRLVFVGLFHVPEAERRLFHRLRTRDIAEFCWDRRVQIVQDKSHPAHSYLSELIEKLGQVRGPWDEPTTSCLPEQVEVVHSASLMAQVKGLPLLLDRVGVEASSEDLTTAIILPDEGLLLPTASSIPDTYEHINISLGYPLDRTPIALLLRQWSQLLEFASRRSGSLPSDQLIALLSGRLVMDYAPEASELIDKIRGQKRFFYPVKDLINSAGPPPSLLRLLLEPIDTSGALIERIQQILEHLIAMEQSSVQGARGRDPQQESEEQDKEPSNEEKGSRLSTFDIEFIYHYLRLVKRLRGLLTPRIDKLKLPTVMHLLDELVHMVSIPFEGDPLKGVQVMGLLETRALHLETMIYLSAQEGVLPTNRYTSTLIPFTLRRGFGLPIGGADDLGADYTFFQSISRAKKLIFVVAPADTKRSGGEESRYIGLLRYVYGVDIKVSSLELSSGRTPFSPIEKPKDKEVMTQLDEYLKGESTLSPSRFNTYISCPLRFYYEVIKGLHEPQDPAILLQSNDFGTILHATMQKVYDRIGRAVTKEAIIGIRSGISDIVEEQYKRLFPQPKGQTKLGGLAEVYCQMVETYVKHVLEYDEELAPFTYLGSEQDRTATFSLTDGRKVHFGGVIDRIDEVEGRIRVVDYKTGDADLTITEWKYLHDTKKKAIVQTLIYCAFYASGDSQSIGRLYPAIYHLKGSKGLSAAKGSFGPLVRLPAEGHNKSAIYPYAEVKEVFERFMTETLTELFDPNIPFRQTEKPQDNCKYCPFASSCGR